MSEKARRSREVRDLALAIREQKRVLLLFLFAILLPSVILGFFGLRALQADEFRMQQLLRREREEFLRRTEDTIRSGVAAFLAELRARADGGADVPGKLIRVSARGDFEFVRERYRIPARERDPRRNGEGHDLLEAERLEYESRAPVAAASLYERLSRRDDPYLRSLGLLGLGRISVRLSRTEEAVSAYRRLAREIPSELERETAAHVAMAAIQIAALEGSAEALAALVDTYRLLLVDRWVICSDVLRFYSAELEGEIESRCASLQGEEAVPCSTYLETRGARDERLRAVETLEAIHERLRRLLVGWGSSELPPRDLVLELPEMASMVLAVRTDDGSVVASVVGNRILAERLLGDDPSGGEILRQVKSSEGMVLLGSDFSDGKHELDTMALREEGMPPWNLTAFHASAAPVATRRNLYFGLTAVLALWLVFGAVLTARSLRQEMELVGMRAELVSLVSHEFKSPITSLRALLDGLRGGAVTDGGRVRQYLGVASAELQRLTRLVNNFLDFSRIESGTRRYHRTPTDLAELLRDLLVPFEARATELGLQVETHIEAVPTVEADADAISQAVLNLLDNAVKNSDGNPWIGIRLALDPPFAAIEVSDRGKGVPPEDVDRIFTRAGDGRGLGLGLPIVKHVMEGHGGRVEVRSEPGKGSTFRLLLRTSPASGDERDADSPRG